MRKTSHTDFDGMEKFDVMHPMYSQISDIRRTLVGNEIVDHSDEVGVAPTTSSFSN